MESNIIDTERHDSQTEAYNKLELCFRSKFINLYETQRKAVDDNGSSLNNRIINDNCILSSTEVVRIEIDNISKP